MRLNKNLIAAFSGILFESYNNTLYGFFAVFLASIFFPNNSFVSPLMASFITFSAGYLLRPLGGIIFGYIGDTWGRKRSLRLSILFTAIPMLIIGTLPTYEKIGFIAPIFLFLCRLFQGISTGSDYTGVIIYVAEQRKVYNKILTTCFLVSCGFLGALIGILFSLFTLNLFTSSWGWRLAFIFGGAMSLLVYYLRSHMEESPLFKEIKQENKVLASPFLTLLREDKIKLITCAIMGGGNLVPIYLATVYINMEFKSLFNFSIEKILINNFFILSLGAILVLSSSQILKRFSEITVIKTVMYCFIVFTLPVYIWALTDPSEFSLIVLQVFIMLGDAPQIAALALLLPKIFSVEKRYSGLGFSYALGQAFLGGTTPIIAMFLVHQTGYAWAPGGLLTIVAIIYLRAIHKAELFIKKN